MQHGNPDQISEKCRVLVAQIPPKGDTRFVFSVVVIPNLGESGSWFDAGSGARPKMWSDAFSPTIIDGPFRLPFVICGKYCYLQHADQKPNHATFWVNHGHWIIRVTHFTGPTG